MLGYLKCHADDSHTTIHWIGDHIFYIPSFHNRELYIKIEIFLLSCQKMMCSKTCVCVLWLAAGWHHETIYRTQVAPGTDPSLSGVRGHSNEGKLHNLEIFIFIFIWTIPPTEMWSQNRERDNTEMHLGTVNNVNILNTHT